MKATPKPPYQAYDATGAFVGSYAVSDGGALNGCYFDWSVGRYATHSGYGARGGGTKYTWVNGQFTDDSQVYSGVSGQHAF